MTMQKPSLRAKSVTGVMPALTLHDFAKVELGRLEPSRRTEELGRVGTILDIEAQARAIRIQARRKGDTSNKDDLLTDLKMGKKYEDAVGTARRFHREHGLLIYLRFAIHDAFLVAEHYTNALHGMLEMAKDERTDAFARVFGKLIGNLDRTLNDYETVAHTLEENGRLKEAAETYGKSGNMVQIVIEDCENAEKERAVRYSWISLSTKLVRGANNHQKAGEIYAKLGDWKGAIREHSDAADAYEKAAQIMDYYGAEESARLECADHSIECAVFSLNGLRKAGLDEETEGILRKSRANEIIRHAKTAVQILETIELEVQIKTEAQAKKAANAAIRSVQYLAQIASTYDQLEESQITETDRSNRENVDREIERRFCRATAYLTNAGDENSAFEICKQWAEAEGESGTEIAKKAYKKLGLIWLENAEAKQKEDATGTRKLEDLLEMIEYMRKGRTCFQNSGERAGLMSITKSIIKTGLEALTLIEENKTSDKLAQVGAILADTFAEEYDLSREIERKVKPKLMGIATNWHMIAAREYERAGETQKANEQLDKAIECARRTSASKRIEQSLGEPNRSKGRKGLFDQLGRIHLDSPTLRAQT
ncbi:hypothetical protein HY990_05035 [Candidatus Micrarchaeota archaeon]|nr:hypothetical protein [Candidatus Micrarchaeota archaeon]